VDQFSDAVDRYLGHFRSRQVSKLEALPGGELRRRRLPSGSTPIELLKQVARDELRWLEWRFEGRPVAGPWGEDRDGRWHLAASGDARRAGGGAARSGGTPQGRRGTR
jgi:hypothetical protein